MKQKVLLASNNAHKIKEIRAILGDFFDIVSLREAGVESDPEEKGKTFEENARIKAVAGMKASGMPCIADDSGLEVLALDCRPGVMSARYSGSHGDDAENCLRNLRINRTVPHVMCALSAWRSPTDVNLKRAENVTVRF